MGIDGLGIAQKLRSSVRALRYRAGPLAATAIAVAITAWLAATTAYAWSAALPRAAAQDVRASPEDGIVVTTPASSPANFATEDRTVRSSVVAAAHSTPFVVSAITVSRTFDLSQAALANPEGAAAVGVHQIRQTYAVSRSAISGSTALVAGAWPTAPQHTPTGVTEIPAVLPQTALSAMGLSVGSVFDLWDSTTGTSVVVRITGTFRYLDIDPAAGLWNTIGDSGVHSAGPFTAYGPLVVSPDAFADQALAVGSGRWVITPSVTDAQNISTLATWVNAVIEAPALSVSNGFQVTSGLPAVLAQLPTRVAAAQAQLLGATALSAALAAVAIIVCCENLVARGRPQAALVRSRGAPRRILVVGALPDVCVLVLSALLGAVVAAMADHLIGGLWAGGSAADAWPAALAVCVFAAVFTATRAAFPPRAADLSAATGRHGGAPGIVRAGLDFAVAILATVALWQGFNARLTATGTSGTSGTSGSTGAVLVVAAAPALAALAGAALCGRLITGAARLSERAAERVHNLPARLAAWELARTPLRHLVPALLCVASISGCGYVAGQVASETRSAQDQAAFSVGANASVALVQPLSVGRVGALVKQTGVTAATPEARIGEGNSTLIAVDASSADHAMTVRPDLASQPTAKMWAALKPSAGRGVAVPGSPVELEVTATLTSPGLSSPTVDLAVHDATGVAYELPLGTLSADGRAHVLSTGPVLGGAAYPLRITGISLSYPLPAIYSVATTLTLSNVAERASARSAPVVIPGADALAGSGWSTAEQSDLEPIPADSCNAPVGSTTTQENGEETIGLNPGGFSRSTSGPDTKLTFASGAGLNMSASCTPSAPNATVALTVTASGPLPAVATATFLHDGGLQIGSTVTETVAATPITFRIVASVSAFPTLAAGQSDGLVTDLSALSDTLIASGFEPPSADSWLLGTVGGASPDRIPVDATVTTSQQVAASILADPLSAVPRRMAECGAAALVLAALLGLLVSLLAASRAAASRDMVLAALGATRRQRVTLSGMLYAAVALPGALLGAALALALCRLLIPVFVLAGNGTPPEPSAVVLYAEPWTCAAAAVVVLLTVGTALATALRRGDPLVLARDGG